MDDYLFQFHVEKCQYVLEETRCIEMYAYSDPVYDTVVENPLPLEQLDDFLGAFARPDLPNGVTRLAGFRMILQPKASDPETFSPSFISLPPDKYSKMMTEFKLPYKGIEGSSISGPFFWTALDDEGRQILQIIYRKVDVTKTPTTRSWELLLSFDFSTGVTTAFCKASPDSYITHSIKHLKLSCRQIGHPMLFPMLIFSYYYSARLETQQRYARQRLYEMEKSLDWMKGTTGLCKVAVDNSDGYTDEHGMIDFDQINRDLNECHNTALWKSPTAYLRVLDGFEEAMSSSRERAGFYHTWPAHTHGKIACRIDFFRKMLRNQEYYQSITLQRIESLRSALTLSCGQIDNRVSFQIAKNQTKLAHSSKREAVSQKVIAILGTVFLPGAYLSAVLGMPFFNWGSSKHNGLYVSPLFWIYWAVTIPLTIAVVGSYILWDHKMSMKAHKEDEAIELRMLEMQKNSQNQAIRSGAILTTVSSKSESMQSV